MVIIIQYFNIQHESSLLELMLVSVCSFNELSVKYFPTINWCAFGFLELLLYSDSCFFLKHKWLKCPTLWQYLHWCLLAGHLKPSMCGVSPHLVHLSFWLVWTCLNFLWTCSSLSSCLSSCQYLWLVCFDLNAFLCFLWNLLGDNSVLWCHSKFTCVACGSLDTCLMCLAVDLIDSDFFAICLTLLAGNLSRSIFELFIVQDTKSSSFRKKTKYVSVEFLLSLVGILLSQSDFELHYTICLLNDLLA